MGRPSRPRGRGRASPGEPTPFPSKGRAPQTGGGAADASATSSGRAGARGARSAGAGGAGPAGRTRGLRPAGLHLMSGSITGRAGASRAAPVLLHLVARAPRRGSLLRREGAAPESESGEDDDRQASHQRSPLLVALNGKVAETVPEKSVSLASNCDCPIVFAPAPLWPARAQLSRSSPCERPQLEY